MKDTKEELRILAGSVIKRMLAAGGVLLISKGFLTTEEVDTAATIFAPELAEIFIGLIAIGASFIGSRIFPKVRKEIAKRENEKGRASDAFQDPS